MAARIFRPAKTAMSSGNAKAREWVLEFEPEAPRAVEPLMGYTASTDMRAQVRLRFASKDEAIRYAEKAGLEFRVEEANDRRRATISYSDNFASRRAQPWTH